MKTSFSISTLLIPFLFTFSNCAQKAKQVENEKENTFFDPIELGEFNGTSNLSIEARFSECGEWGGHKEIIKVTADKQQTLYATYKIYPFNCDSLDYYYGNKNLTPISDRKVILDEQKKLAIINYIQRLTQSRIAQRFPSSNANNVFSIVNSDSTLLIRVYGSKEYEIRSYKKMVSELFK
jgi:hypothetical protein